MKDAARKDNPTMGYATQTARVNIHDELRALLSDETTEALDHVEAMQEAASKASEAMAEARQALKDAEQADLEAGVEAVKDGGTPPKLKAPKAEEKVQEAERHNKAVQTGLRQAQEDFRQRLTAERADLVAPARERTDEAIETVMSAFEAFESSLHELTPALEIAYTVETKHDIATGVRNTLPHELAIALRNMRDALVDNYEEGEQARRTKADKPQVDANEYNSEQPVALRGVVSW